MIKIKNFPKKHPVFNLSDFSVAISLNFIFCGLADFILKCKFKKLALHILNTVENQVHYFASMLRQAIFHDLFCATNPGRIIIGKILVTPNPGHKIIQQLFVPLVLRRKLIPEYWLP